MGNKFEEMLKEGETKPTFTSERSLTFSVPVPSCPEDEISRLKIEAASMNDMGGDIRGELMMKYSFRAKYDPWISVGVRRPKMNLAPQASKDFGDPPELPWEGPGSGAFRSRSKAKGSWFGDHDLDDDGEGPGLAGDGWHAESHLPVQIGGDR